MVDTIEQYLANINRDAREMYDKSIKAYAKTQGISEQLNMRYKKGESHGIPYRSLLPKGLTNVIVAGRSMSCDRKIQGSVRVMPNCLCTGEAAGLAAAIAAWNDRNVHNVDVDALRSRLREYGAYFL